MILYLSSAQHSNLLDFTGLYDRDSTTIKKMVGSFVLKQFIVYDMRNFSHFTEVVLDRPAFGDSDTEFAEAIEEFLTMYSARITVICEGLTESDPLFAALLNSGVGNIVCDTEIKAMQREISECLSETGMTRYNPKERTAKATGVKQYRFDCRNIRIAVLSSQPRMGATTTALGLCAWLRSVGAVVCYVEANTSGHLPLLAQSYEMEQGESGWTYEGISYRTEEPTDPAVNFIVYDAGNDLTAFTQSEIHADLLLLQCGTKPYELGYTLRLQKRFKTEYAYILCPFVSEDTKGDYADALQSDYHKLLFLDCQPDLMNGTSNAKQYKTMITKYIAGA